jgi:acyl carrier protein
LSTSPKDAAFEKLQLILSRILRVPVDMITPLSSMDNLAQWDSLYFLLVIDSVEKAFNIKLNAADLRAFRSVQSFLDVIQLEKV